MELMNVDEKLFAHILNDPFLQGSVGLEGNTFQSTIGFLTHYIDQLPQDTLPDEVMTMLKACKGLVEIENAIRTARSHESTKELSRRLFSDLMALDEGAYLLMPGGWIAASGSHGMIYQISKNSDGDCLFSITNSGAGLNYHEKISSLKKELYNPVLTYKIPKLALNAKAFIRILQMLIEVQTPRLQTQQNINADYLYQTVLQQLAHVEGSIELKTEQTLSHCFTAGQISGTCAQKALHQMLKSRFSSLAFYQRFMYDFKKYTIDSYIKTLKQEGNFKNSNYHSQLKVGIEHALKLLALRSTVAPHLPLFSNEKIATERAQLTQYLSQLSPKSVPPIFRSSVSSEIFFDYALPRSQVETVPEEKTVIFHEAYLSTFPQIGNGKFSFHEMTQCILACETLEQNSQFHEIIDRLENYIFQLPLPQDSIDESLLPDYLEINSQDMAFSFYQHLNLIQRFYYSACNALLSTEITTPSMMLFALSVLTITGHVNATFTLAKESQGFQPFTKHLVKLLSKGSKNTVFLSLSHPRLDERLSHIKSLYQGDTNDPSSYRFYAYYQTLLNEYPFAKEALEARYADLYNNDVSDEHKAYRDKNLTGLYYFFKHKNTNVLDNIPTINALRKTFDIQEEMEKTYARYNDRLSGMGFYTNASSFALAYSYGSITVKSFFISHKRPLCINNALHKAKYTSDEDRIKHILHYDSDEMYQTLNRKRPASMVQLLPTQYARYTSMQAAKSSLIKTDQEMLTQRSIQATDLTEREFFHLRSDPSKQLTLTLAYFNKHITHISSTGIQIYTEANIFQPGLLLAQLNGDYEKQFLIQLNDFTAKGLKHFKKKGALSQVALFFLRLTAKVNQYALQINFEKYQHTWQKFNQFLTHQIELTDELSIKHSLHRYRFESLMAQISHHPLPHDDMNLALTSYFFCQATNNPQEIIDIDARFLFEKAQHTFKKIVQKTPEKINLKKLLQVIAEIDSNYHYSDDELLMVLKYPALEIKNLAGDNVYTLNLKEGLIYKDAQAFSALPTKIMTHPVFIALGLGNNVTAQLSRNHNVYTLNQPTQKVRFITNDASYQSVQRQFLDLSGNHVWYQLKAHSVAMAKHLSLATVDTMACNVSDILKERGNCFWLHPNQTEMLVTNPQQEKICTAIRHSHLWQFSFDEALGVLSASDTFIHKKFTPIEDKKFIHVFKNALNYVIELPRYDLRFELKSLATPPSFYKEGKHYQLDNAPLFLGEGIASLSLSNEQEQICIVPIQPYINKKRREANSEYFLFSQDTSGQIAAHVMDEVAKEKTHLQCWQHTKTQKSFIFKVTKEALYPHTTQEALYLSYLYLGSNQPNKAWEMLTVCDDVLGGLSGSYEELTFLSWIFTALPFKMDEEDHKATASNPKINACQLKALALLTHFYQQGKAFNLPELISSPNNINERYENIQRETVMDFEQTLNTTLAKHYEAQTVMQQETPAFFHLTDSERTSLLNYYHAHLPASPLERTKPLGALGYEWVNLKFAVLKKELALLRNKAIQTPYEAKRAREITHFFSKHEGVARSYSELEYQSINTHISFENTLKTAGLPWEVANTLLDYEAFKGFQPRLAYNQEAALNALEPGMIDRDFLPYFKTYLSIAFMTDLTQKNTLKAYCQSVLRASRHIALKAQTSNIPLLCNVLLRIINDNRPNLIATCFSNLRGYSSLINCASRLPAPELYVAQIVNKTDQLLLTASEIVDSLPEKYTQEEVTISIEDTKALKDITLYPDEQELEFMINRDAWQQEEAIYQESSHSLIKPPIEEETPLSLDEYQAGKAKFMALKNLQKIACELFTDERLTLLKEKTSMALAHHLTCQKNLEKTLLSLANQGPSSDSDNAIWQTERLSGKSEPFDIHRIIRLYFLNDKENYRLKTSLDEAAIIQLHGLTARYIGHSLSLQQLNRIEKENDTVLNADEEEQIQTKVKLGQTLFAYNPIDISQAPELSVFQYFQDLLIRPIQIKAISRLLSRSENSSFVETVEQIIMGGGKSKVISPALAYQKATGLNLVIIEVPASLLRTNYIDLKASSKKFFNQSAELFEFNRTQGNTSQEFEQLYDTLIEVIINKKYIVTTGDALQSLELKYLELLNSPPEVEALSDPEALNAQEEWKTKVHWADKVVSLVRQRADLIIDEVHHGLLLKNKLNYTLGESSRLDKLTLNNILNLYKFLNHVTIKSEHKASFTLMEALKNNTLLSTEQDIKSALSTCTAALITHAQSPLYLLCANLTTQEKSQLADYLHDQGEDIPAFIKASEDDIKNQFALYKEELTHLLPYTLKRNHKENYGPSKLSLHSPEVRSLAIPYIASDVPNERSRFGNPLETVNFSIQSLLIEGLSMDLMKNYLELLQIEARENMLSSPEGSKQLNPYVLQFNALMGDDSLSLLEIDLEEVTLLSKIHQTLSSNQSLIFEVLAKHSLKHIKTDPEILHSDAYNHVDLVRSCQGMTGTPWNHSTYHQRLTFDKTVSQGSDGLVYHSLLEKKPTLIPYEFKTTEQTIKDLLNRYEDTAPIRAFIDISATFKGVPNLDIATGLANYFKNQPHKFSLPEGTCIEHILYFNENNEISALSLHDHPNGQPIIIASSDVAVINARLGNEPKARFTLYDQAHTVGTDLKQMNRAKALVMIDKRTSLSSFFQGVMRLRGFIEGNQSLDIITPPSMSELTVETLCLTMHENELTQLKEDNYQAAQLKLSNVLRSQLMTDLLAIEGENAALKKQILFTHFKSVFVDYKSADLFALYGGLTQQVDTKKLLVARQEALLLHYATLARTLDKEVVISDSGSAMRQKMSLIIAQASENTVCNESQSISTGSLAEEVEIQNEVEIEIEKEMQKECFNPLLDDSKYLSWFRSSWYDDSISLSTEHHHEKTLKEICQSVNAQCAVPEFTSNIKATCNFYQSYEHQTSYLSMYLKPVHTLLFIPENESLKCYLLSQEESVEISEKFEFFHAKQAWLGTTNHHILKGMPPAGWKNKAEYQEIIEQVRYFNGEFSLLLAQDPPLTWLMESSRAKLTFFSEHLYQNHETLPHELIQLERCLLNSAKACQFALANPLLNGKTFDWQAKFPEMEPEEINDLKRMLIKIKACHDAWRTPQTDETDKNLTLSPTHIGYLKLYQKRLNSCSSLINALPVKHPLLNSDKLLTLWSNWAELSGQPAKAIKDTIDRVKQQNKLLEQGDLILDLIYDMLIKERLDMPAPLITLLVSQTPMNEKYYENILLMAHKDIDIYRLLLTNSSLYRNEKKLTQLAKGTTKETCLLLHATQTTLTNERASILLFNAQGKDFFKRLLTALSANSVINITNVMREFITTPHSLNTLEIICLLNSMTDINDFINLFKQIKKIDNSLPDVAQRLNTLIKQEKEKGLTRDILEATYECFKDETMGLAIISHPSTTQKILLNLSYQLTTPKAIHSFLTQQLPYKNKDAAELDPATLASKTLLFEAYKKHLSNLTEITQISAIDISSAKLSLEAQLQEVFYLTLLERSESSRPLSDLLLLDIIKNTHCTETLAVLIKRTPLLSETLMLELISHTKSTQVLFDELVKKQTLSLNSIKAFMKAPQKLSESAFIHLIQSKAINSPVIASMLPLKSSDAVITEVLKKGSLSENVFNLLSQKKLTQTHLLSLSAHKDFPNKQLEMHNFVLTHETLNKDILLTLIKKTSSFDLLINIINSKRCEKEPEVITEINSKLTTLTTPTHYAFLDSTLNWLALNMSPAQLIIHINNNHLFDSSHLIKMAPLLKTEVLSTFYHKMKSLITFNCKFFLRQPKISTPVLKEIAEKKKTSLTPEETALIIERLQERLKDSDNPSASDVLKSLYITQLESLLKEITAYGSAGEDDKQVEIYHQKIRLKFNACKNNDDITALFGEIKITRDALNSSSQLEEVKAIMLTLQPRILSYWPLTYFAQSYLDKIDRIHTALSQVPIEQRANFFEENETSHVRNAIASHRHTFFTFGAKTTEEGLVYMNENNEIDESKAANSFKIFSQQCHNKT